MLPSSGSNPPPSDTGESLKWPRLDRVVGRGGGRGDTGDGVGKGGHGGGEIPVIQWQERSGSTSTLTGWLQVET